MKKLNTNIHQLSINLQEKQKRWRRPDGTNKNTTPPVHRKQILFLTWFHYWVLTAVFISDYGLNLRKCSPLWCRKGALFQVTVKIWDYFSGYLLISIKTLTKHRHWAPMLLFGLDFRSYNCAECFRADSSLHQAETAPSRLCFENKKWEQGGEMQKHLNSLCFSPDIWLSIKMNFCLPECLEDGKGNASTEEQKYVVALRFERFKRLVFSLDY